MKQLFAIAAAMILSTAAFSQTSMKEYKVGHIVTVSLPEYMMKAGDLNSSSIIQYKNTVKDVYGFIIEDNKEEMLLSDISYASIKEFYDDFIKDFLAGEEKRKVGVAAYQKKGDTNFAEADITYYDKDAKADIYYLVGIVETKTSFYKILSWCTVENKAKFKAYFQKIIYSLKD